MNEVFKKSKLKPLIKFTGYDYIGTHNSYEGTNYYVRQYDTHNNYEFMEAKIEGTPGVFKKFMLAAGTSIKIVDSFMYSYLKHRNDKDIKTLIKKGFIEKSLKENKFEKYDELKKIYTTKVPTEITKTDYYKKLVNDGYEVLYVKNIEANKDFNTVSLVMVKEEKQEIMGADLSYVLFRSSEFVVRPSYVNGKGKEKYMQFMLPDLNIPVDILNNSTTKDVVFA